MSRAQAKNLIKKYGDLLRERNFLFSQLYLFGSYAEGRPTKESDIDVAVVTKNDDIKNYLDQKMRLWELAVEIDSRLEPTLLSEKELQGKSPSILGDEVKKYGIKVV